jgi:UDP-galactopyranose mutase
MLPLGESIANADVIVVGAGLFGLTVAEQVANVIGLRVLIIEKREHIGGNAFSYIEPETNVEVHKYGTHIFHTNNRKVFDYISKFTSFTDYRHHVWTKHAGRVFSMPISLATLNAFYGKDLSPQEARKLIPQHLSKEKKRGG